MALTEPPAAVTAPIAISAISATSNAYSSRSCPSSWFENDFTKLIRFDMIPPPRHLHRHHAVLMCGVAAVWRFYYRGATPRHAASYRNGYATAQAASSPDAKVAIFAECSARSWREVQPEIE